MCKLHVMHNHDLLMCVCFALVVLAIAGHIRQVNCTYSLMVYHQALHSCWQSIHFVESCNNTYCGVDKLDKSKDMCNFYAPQLRIRIEQAFGLLICKWRIFKKLTEMKLHRGQHVVQACFQLHNFCTKISLFFTLEVDDPPFPVAFVGAGVLLY